MGKYLILVKGGRGVHLKKASPDARNAFLSGWKDWLQALKQKRCLILGSALMQEGIAISYSGNADEVPDNYDMASDMVVGFCVIEAKDEMKGLAIMQDCPFLADEFTSCELRELRSL